MKGMQGKGDRFVVFKDDGLWYWHFIVTNSPSTKPTAKSGRGYQSKNQAIDAIKKLRRAVIRAPGEPIVE